MDELLSMIKHTRFVKTLRTDKWKKHAKRTMLPKSKAAKCERQPEKIEEIVRSHIAKYRNELQGLDDKLEDAINKSGLLNRPEVNENQLKTDILFWHFAYGFSVNEYLCYGFIDKTKEERKKFLSDRDSIELGYDFNDIDAMMIFTDKMNTYNKYQKYYGREAISISADTDFEKFVHFAREHNQFIKKNVLEACGRSIELIRYDKETRTDKELFRYLISEGKVILEELVIQSDETSVFNASSVNTIRCITLNTKKGTLIPYCFMKIGREGAFIDNGAAGGILVGIDPETGVLGTNGVDEYGRRYEIHPDSKIMFKGYQLPAWESMVELCKKAANEMPDVHLIGWDMAHTNNGWVIIEGNAMTELIGPQGTWLRGIREDVASFSEML